MKTETESKIYYLFNLNQSIKVRLKDIGYQRLADLHNEFIGRIQNWEYRTAEFYKHKADANGYSTFQAWQFIESFGSVTGLAKTQYYDTNILIAADDLEIKSL